MVNWRTWAFLVVYGIVMFLLGVFWDEVHELLSMDWESLF